MVVALDTNFLVYCAKQKIDFLHEIGRLCAVKHDIIVPLQAISELQKLSLGKNIKDREAAVIALHLLEKYKREGKLKIKKIDGADADSALLELDKKGSIIATMDNALKQRIKHAKIITIRQFRHLDFI